MATHFQSQALAPATRSYALTLCSYECFCYSWSHVLWPLSQVPISYVPELVQTVSYTLIRVYLSDLQFHLLTHGFSGHTRNTSCLFYMLHGIKQV